MDNNNILDIFKKALKLKIENDFSRGRVWQVNTGWQGKIVLSIVTKYLNNDEKINIKKNTLSKIDAYTDKKIIELVFHDIIGKNYFTNNAFNMFNQKQTEEALLLMLSNQDKNFVFSKLLLQYNIIKQNNVADTVWLNKKLFSKILTKSNIDMNENNIKLMLDYTSDKHKVEAFKKLYSLVKENITEQSFNKMEDLENKHLSKVQKIILSKSKPTLIIKKQNQEEMDNFIFNNNSNRKVIININLNAQKINEMGFGELKRYMKNNTYESYIDNNYAKFELNVSSSSISGIIEYDIEKFKENSNVLEIVLKKTMIKLLKEIEENPDVLLINFREFVSENITPEFIDKELARDRSERLVSKISDKENNNKLRKKI